ncbi:hypothetical protein [uncultured Shewanella sp.]|uniref:hypothetical protein n=1 Tax=uncultured Shewanella sp. TaxID=173975 RepID=UPI003703EF85
MNEKEKKDSFINLYFPNPVEKVVLDGERVVIDAIQEIASSEFGKRKYVLGLAIDFVLLAQVLSEKEKRLVTFRPAYSQENIFFDFELVKSRGGTKANTLTFVLDGNIYGIRKIEENVVDFFHGADRSGYPSAYVYNTGQWTKFISLLELCFTLSEGGRLEAVSTLIDFGLEKMPKNIYFDRKNYSDRIFETVISKYPRQSGSENGGLSFQAIVFGFLFADRPHLHIIADKVRTGSARQKRIGDIDCYDGLTLEYSVEVKDFEITSENFDRHVAEFIRQADTKKTDSAVICAEFEKDMLVDMDTRRTIFIDNSDLRYIVSTWDWKKQDKALQGMLHYLAHIEQNPQAVTRLTDFIRALDSSHNSLSFI